MSILDINAAISAIRQFNEDVETFAMDLLAYRHLGLAASKKVTIAEQVILLDRLWATQMFRKSGQVKRVIQSIEACEGRIPAVCGALRDHSLQTSPAEVTAAAKRLRPIAMGHFGTDESERRYSPYSFATKYLHWSTRRHFPIMDSRSRLAIFQLIQGKDDWPRIKRISPGPEDFPLRIARICWRSTMTRSRETSDARVHCCVCSTRCSTGGAALSRAPTHDRSPDGPQSSAT